MKQRNLTLMIPVLVLAALVARTVQIFVAIDRTTGFYATDSMNLGKALTAIVVILCAAVAVAAKFNSLSYKPEREGDKIIPVASGIVSLALFYEMLAESFVLQEFSWQVVLLKITGLLTAVYFALLVLSKFISLKIPVLCHTLPAIYMIIRIICSFISISSLSLIPENIFLIASYCCAMLFFVGYAAVGCGVDLNGHSLYMRSVLAFAVCFVTAFSNIIVNVTSSGGYSHIPLSSQVVLTAMSIFIACFTYVSFLDNKE